MKKTTLWKSVSIGLLVLLIVPLVFLWGGTSVRAGFDAATEVYNAQDYGNDLSAVLSAIDQDSWNDGEIAGIKLVDGATYSADDLLQVNTIFNNVNKRLPIYLGGAKNVKFTTEQDTVASANSFSFFDLTFQVSSDNFAFYAGAGNVAFSGVSFVDEAGESARVSLYGDNYTQAVFEGWENINVSAERGNSKKIATSLTVADGTRFVEKSHSLAAVGFSGDDYEPAEGVSVAVTPKDTSASLIVDGASLSQVSARLGFAPVADAIIDLKSGTVENIFADNGTENGDIEIYRGSITLRVSGGEVTGANGIQGLSKAYLSGDFTVEVSGDAVVSNIKSSSLSEIEGCSYLNISGGTFTGEISGNSSNLSTVNNITGGTFEDTCSFFGVGSGSARKVFNNISGGTFKDGSAIYGGHSSAGYVRGVVNNFTGGNFEEGSVIYGGNRGGTVYGDVVNNFKGGEFEHISFFGGSKAGSVNGHVTNNFKDGIFKSGSSVYGSSAAGTVTGTVTNNYKGTAFQDGSSVYGGSNATVSLGAIVNNYDSSDFDTTVYGGNKAGSISGGTVTNNYNGATFRGTVYGGSQSGTVKVAIQNNYNNGVFESHFYGGSKADTISGVLTNTFNGGTFAGGSAIYGGSESGTHSKLVKNVFNGGTFLADSAIFGGSSQAVSFNGGILNDYGTGATFSCAVYGGNEAGELSTGTITNTYSGATFTSPVFGGNKAGNVTVAIQNNYNAGSLGSAIYGGNETDTVSGTITNTFNGATSDASSTVCGGNKDGTVSGAITNRYLGVEFGNKSRIYGGSGAGTVSGNITNYYGSTDSTVIFYDNGAYCYGGSQDGEITESSTITNHYNHANFSTRAVHGGNNTLGVINGNIVNHYNDGSVFNKVVCGGCESGSVSNGTISNTFNPGCTFLYGVIAGGASNCDTNTKGISSTIHGGTFGSTFTIGTYQNKTIANKATLTINPTGPVYFAKAIKAGSSKESVSLVGSKTNSIYLGTDASLKLDSVSGQVQKILPNGTWSTGKTYLNAPSSAITLLAVGGDTTLTYDAYNGVTASWAVSSRSSKVPANVTTLSQLMESDNEIYDLNGNKVAGRKDTGNKLTSQQLADLPVANSSMTSAELRQLCLDFFKLQLSFQWVPNEEIPVYPTGSTNLFLNYFKKYKENNTVTSFSNYTGKALNTETIYAGIPYQNVSTGNLYRWMEYYDESTGVMYLRDAFVENGGYDDGDWYNAWLENFDAATFYKRNADGKLVDAKGNLCVRSGQVDLAPVMTGGTDGKYAPPPGSTKDSGPNLIIEFSTYDTADSTNDIQEGDLVIDIVTGKDGKEYETPRISYRFTSFRYFFSQCSVGSTWGWARVVNSANFAWTTGCTVYNGFIPVGGFTYQYEHEGKTYGMDTIDTFGSTGNIGGNPLKWDTIDVAKYWIAQKGTNAMYDCYAKLQPADCLVSGGHAMMVKDVHVVRNSDGSVNPVKSYVTVYESFNDAYGFYGSMGESQTPYEVHGGYVSDYDDIVTHINTSILPSLTSSPSKMTYGTDSTGNTQIYGDRVFSFQYLLTKTRTTSSTPKNPYLPFTFAEFHYPDYNTNADSKAYIDFYNNSIVNTKKGVAGIYANTYDLIDSSIGFQNFAGIGAEEAKVYAKIGSNLKSYQDLVKETNLTYSDFQNMVIATNYVLSDVFVTISDADGNVMKEMARRSLGTYGREVAIGSSTKSVTPNGESILNYVQAFSYPDAQGRNFKIEISVQLGNGELITLFNGDLKA